MTASSPPGSPIHERTEVLSGTDNVMNLLSQFLSKANRIDSCGDNKSPSISIEVDLYKKLLVIIKNKGLKIRQVTEITKQNIHYCKELLKFGYEIRHLEGIKANFSVSETEYLATPTLKEAQPIQQVIYSNVKDIVEQQRYVFESFWNKAIQAEQRMKEIEEGLESAKTDVIQNPQSIERLFIDMIKSAKHEILLILPTINAFLREQRAGIIQLLKQAAIQRGLNIRILSPTNNVIENILKNITTENEQQGVKKKGNFDLRSINMPFEEIAMNTVTILVVDKKESLIFEKIDDSQEEFVKAVGLATYSNSKPTVISYLSIFESLWKQVQLYEQLKVHDKMQKEFINIASHEMKTPTQAIIGYTDLVQNHPEKREQMIAAISRNAIRLQRLTNDILEVTRIESQTLNLHKEQFDLNDLILSILEDYNSQIEKDKINVKLLYDKSEKDKKNSLFVEADKDRISQVIYNLLSNAVKFTSMRGGRAGAAVSVIVEKKKNDNNDQDDIIVSVKDTGEGIHPEILPRLFTKFATKSFTGTGLGLFISKGIVEAHGGKMWAKNNANIKGARGEWGATFSFSLPISKEEKPNISQEEQNQQQIISSGTYQE